MLERMDEFFAARVEGYEEPMMTEANGCNEAYPEIAKLVPDICEKLLVLGCGTGGEWEYIFEKLPNLQVTCIDLVQAKLDKLQEKYAEKNVTTVCGNYFDVCFGAQLYECAVSFETMPHFSHKAKVGLREKIYKALKPGGTYIECSALCHYDTPCTIENQIAMFLEAGFAEAKQVFHEGNIIIIAAKKAEILTDTEKETAIVGRKYFCRSAERQGTCYHEFQKGKWDEHTFWKEDSLLIHDDVHLELKLHGLFKQVLPSYNAFGDTAVNKEQWQAIYHMAEEIGGESFDAIKEADVWVQECFETEEVFYMLGI